MYSAYIPSCLCRFRVRDCSISVMHNFVSSFVSGPQLIRHYYGWLIVLGTILALAWKHDEVILVWLYQISSIVGGLKAVHTDFICSSYRDTEANLLFVNSGVPFIIADWLCFCFFGPAGIFLTMQLHLILSYHNPCMSTHRSLVVLWWFISPDVRGRKGLYTQIVGVLTDCVQSELYGR